MRLSAEIRRISLILLPLIALAACKEPVPVTPELPGLSIDEPTVLEGSASAPGLAEFTVSLSKAFDQAVTFDYATQDLSAQAGIDYRGARGSLSIPAGQTTVSFTISLVGDEIRERGETFEVLLSQLVNATGTKTRSVVNIGDDDATLPKEADGYITPNMYPEFSLVWADEFDGTTMDPGQYNFEQGNNNGWGNKELEYYTSNNHSLTDGKLIIEARNEGSAASPYYTSSRITTQGKKEFQYGRIDIRAKVPAARGLWPALWMIGGNFGQVGWPACGEIDIMELVGQNPSTVVGSAHWGSSAALHRYKNNSISISPDTYDEEYHVFSIAWRRDYIAWYMDDQLYFSITPADMGDQPWPFNTPQFFIMNVAVGGEWPGPPPATTVFPQRMSVDYVRVFQHTD